MEPIGALIFRLFEKTSRHGAWVVSCVEGCWARVAGERVAAACRPAGFEDGVLTLEVRDPDWVGPLRELEGELGERLREATAGVVSRVRVR